MTLQNYPVFALSRGMGFALLLVIIWSLVWKGIALWKAARRGDKAWFVVLLVLNTVGILEIIYIYAVAKKPKAQQPPTGSL